MTTSERERRKPVGRREQDRWNKWDKRVRDLTIWAIMAAALINELFYEEEPRPSALVFIASMLGMPLVLRADEKRREKDK